MFSIKLDPKTVLTSLTTATIFGVGSPAAAQYAWMNGQSQGEGYGHLTINVGDVTGDGRDDFLISAPNNNVGGERAGRVYVRNGFNSQTLWIGSGEDAGDRYGYSCAAYRDEDGDLFVAIGSPWSDDRREDAGKVTVYWDWDRSIYSFRSSRVLTGRKEGDRFGWSIALAELDGNDMPELIVGAPWNDRRGANAGLVEVYAGSDGDRIWRRYGDGRKDRFGYAVAALEPRDGARFDRFAVSAPWNSDTKKKAGKVLVFKGGGFDLLHEKRGKRVADKFGLCVASIGDADGDGWGDFACGSPLYDARGRKNSGRVDAFSTRSGRRLWKRVGKETQERFGRMVAAAPDLPGAGAPYCMIGAPRHDGEGDEMDRGRIEVVSDSGRVAEEYLGFDGGTRLGSAMTTAVLVLDDVLLFGRPRANNNTGNIRRAVWNGGAGPLGARDGDDAPALDELVTLLASIGHVGEAASDDDDLEIEGHAYDFDDDGDVDADDLMTLLEID